MRLLLTSLLVLVALTAACSDSGSDYGPPPTCLAGEEGHGHWEYVPNEIREPSLIVGPDPEVEQEPEPSGPIAPARGTMVWTGSRVLIWGEDKGASFDPETKRWKPLPTENGPGQRQNSVSVWTGSRWVVWGGEWVPEPGKGHVPRSDGAIYDPETETWEQIPMDGAPQSAVMKGGAIVRGQRESAVWTGSEVLFWTVAENESGECVHEGALYDLEMSQWQPMSFEGSPLGKPWAAVEPTSEPRFCPSSGRGPLIWTGDRLIAWAFDMEDPTRVHGGLYSPQTNSWRSMNLEGSPLPRWGAYATWTGSEVLVWGGSVGSGTERRHMVTGGFYDPSTDRWRPMSTVNAPNGADASTGALWTGNELLVPAVEDGCPVGARYDLATDTWSAMAPSPREFYDRYGPELTWAGSAAFLWGGYGHLFDHDDGALYYP